MNQPSLHRLQLDGLLNRVMALPNVPNGTTKSAFVDPATATSGMPPGSPPPGMAPPGAMPPGAAPPGAVPPMDPAAAGGAPPPGDPAAAGGDPASAGMAAPVPPPPGGDFAATPPAPPAPAPGSAPPSALEATWSGDPSLNPKVRVDESSLLLVLLRLNALIATKMGISVPPAIMTILPPELMGLPQEPQAPPSGGGGAGAGAISPPTPVDPVAPAAMPGAAGAPAGGQTKTSSSYDLRSRAASLALLSERAKQNLRG